MKFMLTAVQCYKQAEYFLSEGKEDKAKIYLDLAVFRAGIEEDPDPKWDEILRRNEHSTKEVHYYADRKGTFASHQTTETLCNKQIHTIYTDECEVGTDYGRVTCSACIEEMADLLHGPVHFVAGNGVATCGNYLYLRRWSRAPKEVTCTGCLKKMGPADKEPEDAIPLEFQGTPEMQLIKITSSLPEMDKNGLYNRIRRNR